ncbi:peroxiredoxin family protein [Edaphobacter modestus]|uniref:thioredoxin-dependent peroxiredoxin n=1 Tax=Edaphobacter modestus TaxID=388466 RepID=A0A4Q7YRP1_9BACT|nr:redoxin domain-containing protein [Edaphobacter modestus]RZU40180.1 peroxiredoxin [Edaphobacter modestus]
MTYSTLIRRVVCCSLLVAVSPFAFGLPEPGDAAPDFQLQSQTGSKVSLKDYKGEWIILFFFGDHSSDEIGLAARNLQRDLAKYNAFNASVIGIGRTTPESNRVWAEKNELTFTLLADPDQAIAKAYGVPAEVASSSGNQGIYEVIVAPGGKVQLPRIAVNNIDGESTSLLACLQYFKEHPGHTDGP